MNKPPIKLGHGNTIAELTAEQSDIIRKKLALMQSCFGTGEWFPSYLNSGMIEPEMNLLCDTMDTCNAEQNQKFYKKLIDWVANQPPIDIHTTEAEPYPEVNGITIKPIREEEGLLQPNTFYTYTIGPGSTIPSRINHFHLLRQFLHGEISHIPDDTREWMNATLEYEMSPEYTLKVLKDRRKELIEESLSGFAEDYDSTESQKQLKYATNRSYGSMGTDMSNYQTYSPSMRYGKTAATLASLANNPKNSVLVTYDDIGTYSRKLNPMLKELLKGILYENERTYC